MNACPWPRANGGPHFKGDLCCMLASQYMVYELFLVATPGHACRQLPVTALKIIARAATDTARQPEQTLAFYHLCEMYRSAQRALYRPGAEAHKLPWFL